MKIKDILNGSSLYIDEAIRNLGMEDGELQDPDEDWRIWVTYRMDGHEIKLNERQKYFIQRLLPVLIRESSEEDVRHHLAMHNLNDSLDVVVEYEE